MRRALAGFACGLMLAPAALAKAPVCTTGTLWAGSPDYDDPSLRAKDGQALLDVPPLGFRDLLFSGDHLVTAVGPEVWVVDTAAAEPVLERLFGRDGERVARPGKCKQARLVNISGLALGPDGSISGADQMSNLIFQITDPFGPDCAVNFLAGATEPQDVVVPGRPARFGDADGPGAEAMLGSPDWVAVLDDGTIYFIDSSYDKLKRVLPDAAHTVETVVTLPEGTYFDLKVLNGALYALGQNSVSEGFIVTIDPASGEVEDFQRGRSDYWLGDGAINVSGLATDGKGLFTTQSGNLLYVPLKGDIEKIAGTGIWFDYEGDYDPHQPHPADELQLIAMRRTQTAGSNVFLAYHKDALYFSATGRSPYVMRIDCK
ncbi:hypothetical protein sos41_31860 [Alphaproteobacteria bacterium SO-S41]|nr:hypothetical protein sos41_31860 [Alphaproteobacteria bacterium SO-S41]